jgi:hypothetical protein
MLSRVSRTLKRSGEARGLRGGNWNNTANNLESSNRNDNDPTNENNNIGFRVASPWTRRAAAKRPVRRGPKQESSARIAAAIVGAATAPNSGTTGRSGVPEPCVSAGEEWAPRLR